MQTSKLRLKRQLFSLDKLIAEVAGNFRYTITSHNVEITDDLKVKVYADKARIHQVLVNLISNAIKYSPDADKVKISKKPEGDKVTIAIQDFGMGIPLAEQSRIYERFFRAKGLKEGSIPGLGLGLFISNEIIKQHGGKLWAKSKVGKGSTFYFTLPTKSPKKVS